MGSLDAGRRDSNGVRVGSSHFSLDRLHLPLDSFALALAQSPQKGHSLVSEW